MKWAAVFEQSVLTPGESTVFNYNGTGVNLYCKHIRRSRAKSINNNTFFEIVSHDKTPLGINVLNCTTTFIFKTKYYLKKCKICAIGGIFYFKYLY